MIEPPGSSNSEASPNDDGIAVACRGLTKTYGSGAAAVEALRGVDLDVRWGELMLLVGPSGCGKTTLVSVIAGLLDPDAGRCRVLDRDLQALDPNGRARFRGRSLGFLFQSPNLLPALTAAENVAVPLLLNRVSRKAAAARAEEALDRVGLGTRAGALPGELSGGQQQRVAIARALVHEPSLVVCDEPTSNLDHAAGQDVMTTLRQLARRPDRALIVVTHDPRILAFGDRRARMDDGRIVEVLAAAEGPGGGESP